MVDNKFEIEYHLEWRNIVAAAWRRVAENAAKSLVSIENLSSPVAGGQLLSVFPTVQPKNISPQSD